MDKILISVAWPYANGAIHLGHLAGSILPADIFRRYNLLKGNTVMMVSGSDQHGTPITVTAEKEGKTPLEIAERFHDINKKSIEDMNIGFSLFTKTHNDNHIDVVQDIFKRLLEKGFLYKKETMQYYCPKCERFLPDRYVIGSCPSCSKDVKGDQCENCGKTFELGELKNAKCLHCGTAPEVRGTEHFFLRLSAFQEQLIDYLKKTKWSRSNVELFTKNWMRDGLIDRAITRDMDWGIPVPVEGWEGKSIYVWFEAVIGYLSASIEFSKVIGDPNLWEKYWKEKGTKHYYFLGKDNIPFHSIIWPAILMGYGSLNLPTDIPANEFLNYKGGKFSKSAGAAIDVHSVLQKYDPDIIRYYLSVNMPDTHDTEFTWDDFQAKINNELVSALGNFYHRCLSFTKKNFDVMPESDGSDIETVDEIKRSLKEYEKYMKKCDIKKGIRTIMDLAHWGNKYFDSVKPWALVKEDKKKCGATMNTSLRIVKALAVMSWPFMPSSSERIWDMIGQAGTIKECGFAGIMKEFVPGVPLKEPVPVYKKVETEKEEPEVEGFDAFRKLDLRVGEILEARDHPDAEKLFILKVDVGEERQIVAGLRPYFSKEEMVGKKVIVVYNLKPAKLRGERSEGMLLAADDEDVGGNNVLLLKPSADLPNGTGMDCGVTTKKGNIEYKEFQNAVMKVVSVKDGKITADGFSADVEGSPDHIAIVIDNGILPITDGKDHFATVDGKMDGAKIR